MADWTKTATKVTFLPGQKVRRKQMASAASLGDVCYVNSDGKLAKADASAASTAKGLLFVIIAGEKGNTAGTVAADEYVTACYFGPIPGFTSLDETTQYWLSDTAGKGADETGTVVRGLGYPDSSEIFMFNPGDDYPS